MRGGGGLGLGAANNNVRVVSLVSVPTITSSEGGDGTGASLLYLCRQSTHPSQNMSTTRYVR